MASNTLYTWDDRVLFKDRAGYLLSSVKYMGKNTPGLKKKSGEEFFNALGQDLSINKYGTHHGEIDILNKQIKALRKLISIERGSR